jgi:hypothetical protein
VRARRLPSQKLVHKELAPPARCLEPRIGGGGAGRGGWVSGRTVLGSPRVSSSCCCCYRRDGIWVLIVLWMDAVLKAPHVMKLDGFTSPKEGGAPSTPPGEQQSAELLGIGERGLSPTERSNARKKFSSLAGHGGELCHHHQRVTVTRPPVWLASRPGCSRSRAPPQQKLNRQKGSTTPRPSSSSLELRVDVHSAGFAEGPMDVPPIMCTNLLVRRQHFPDSSKQGTSNHR